VRLTEARRLLLTGDPRVATVTSAAAQAGFWHMAQFAQDYRNMFRELPSQTLRRNTR
jgi:AraC family ethanolamine operon transcriptional activator